MSTDGANVPEALLEVSGLGISVGAKELVADLSFSVAAGSASG